MSTLEVALQREYETVSTTESLSTLCLVTTILIAACGEPRPGKAISSVAGPDQPISGGVGDAAPEGSAAFDEQRVLVTGRSILNKTILLKGALVSFLQDGQLTSSHAPRP